MFGADGRIGNGDLTSGSYGISNVDAQSDGCEIDPEGLDGTVLNVQVDGSEMVVNEIFVGEIHAGVFDTGEVVAIDLEDDGYDCVVELERHLDGFTTAEDEAAVDFRYSIRVLSGSECELALERDLPCDSRADFSIARLAAASLADGFYGFPNAGVSPDACGLGGSFYGQFAGGDVTVSSTELQIDLDGTALVYEIDGVDLYDPTSPGVVSFDFNDPAVASDAGVSQTYDCVLTQDIQYIGFISSTAPNRFRIEDHYEFEGSGSECDDLGFEIGLPLPCTSIDGTDAILE